MNWPLRTAFLLGATIVALAACSASASAATQVGIGEENLSLFNDPGFGKLGIKRARIIMPWNVALTADGAYLDEWLRAARSRGVEPFVHFGVAGISRCPRRPCHLPSVGAYAQAFKAFHSRWPFVRVVGVWNEANHRAQPTFKNPKRAAQYYNVVRRLCRGCRIVAADVLDDHNMVRWVSTFRRFAKRPRLWGLHNYRDTNPRRGQLLGGTKRLLSITRGQVWLTETGGIVKFVLPNGRTLFPFSEARANKAMRRLFKLARTHRRRIKRIYLWGWRAPVAQNRFDSGLLANDGKPRPSYLTLERLLGTRYFRP
jgi:polysaccharide biosynthesis protein PslG